MLKGVDQKLKASFPRELSSRLRFVNLAVDGRIAPRVVGQRHGYTSTRRLPEVVKAWRQQVQ